MHTLTMFLLLAASLLPGEAPADADLLSGGDPRSRALVVALHGGSFRGRSAPERARELLAELDGPARGARLRLLVPVAEEPDLPGPYRPPWLDAAGELQVLSLLRRELSARRADPRRLYLAGHGAGATAALTLAARHGDLLAGVAAWSGTPEPLWDGQRRVVGLAEPVIEGLAGVPVWLRTCPEDPYLDRDALQLLVDGLRRQAQERGTPAPEWIQGSGGHGYGPEGPAPGLLWLARQRRATSGS